ncbi:hypothetical protein HNQ93_001056 [Hymenobacter luteus]|uniref:Uncharacterized protein n=1 Tax=Hymenobacter luteus TaxID=1411122 RepID=A0A7W9SYR1_9BACT|nr:hypothetical protein [Hymenobacter luteus]
MASFRALSVSPRSLMAGLATSAGTTVTTTR